jgi:hypothetical protein
MAISPTHANSDRQGPDSFSRTRTMELVSLTVSHGDLDSVSNYRLYKKWPALQNRLRALDAFNVSSVALV